MPVRNVNEILDENGDLPDDLLLGRLVLFTVSIPPSVQLTRPKLEQDFINAGLDTSLLPPEINPADAFKKATSDAKDTYALPNGSTCEVLCRDVTSTKEFIRRQITREVKDSAQKQLSYAPALTCTFWRPKSVTVQGKTTVQKGSERIQVLVETNELDPHEVGEAVRIKQEIEDRYAHYYHGLDSNRVRHTVREYLKHLNAIEIKGGVYFVHVSHSEELARLQTLVNTLGQSMMHTIPIVDIKRERIMVTQAFEREAAQALTEVAREARELQAQRKTITPAAYAKLKDRLIETATKAHQHVQTLEISQSGTVAAMQVAKQALDALHTAMVQQTIAPAPAPAPEVQP